MLSTTSPKKQIPSSEVIRKTDRGSSCDRSGFSARLIRHAAVLCLLVSLVPIPATAAEPEASGAYYDWKKTGKPERPYLHAYHQTVVTKIFLCSMDRKTRERGKVALTFEQVLDVIERLDKLTCGVPKIAYLVGWQYNGHDSKYPAWHEVNEALKRPGDASARDSYLWLAKEAKKHHTTVSVHVNMRDAHPDSPLWDQYIKRDVIAREADGSILKHTWGNAVSYTREWQEGLAQKRIDDLIELLQLKEAGTVHVDAFHSTRSSREMEGMLSPHHGISQEEDITTQRRILRYWRDRGIDFTSEFSTGHRKDPFIGLQPMAWHFTSIEGVPPQLYCGTPLQAESSIQRDPQNLPGIRESFFLKVVPWMYRNNTDPDKQPIEDFTVNKNRVGLPMVWREDKALAFFDKELVKAEAVTLPVPRAWGSVVRVEALAVSQAPLKSLGTVEVKDGKFTFTVQAGQGIVFRPSSD